ncbi:MAG TPA: sulfite exporter TauE/SafE family protein [Chitinivibrionales bacterium]|nr:sulfite exporter TauE/SafE family protein [Chitinivibrionales bacterium]
MDITILWLTLLFLIVAFLFSSVGQGGASGYLAVMALFSVPVVEMRPIALVLNIIVASIATYKYVKAKRFSLRTFIIFVLLSIPFSFVGGAIQLPGRQIKIVIGIILILSSFVMLLRVYLRSEYEVKKVPVPLGFICGSIIGFFSGLTSVGGGIFLSPLLVFFKWSSVWNTSGIAAAFILVNSISGLLGQLSQGVTVNARIWPFAAAVVVGGYLGSDIGSRKLNNRAIILILFVVLIIAAIKIIIT